jgi:hypothetical protein
MNYGWGLPGATLLKTVGIPSSVLSCGVIAMNVSVKALFLAAGQSGRASHCLRHNAGFSLKDDTSGNKIALRLGG